MRATRREDPASQKSPAKFAPNHSLPGSPPGGLPELLLLRNFNTGESNHERRPSNSQAKCPKPSCVPCDDVAEQSRPIGVSREWKPLPTAVSWRSLSFTWMHEHDASCWATLHWVAWSYWQPALQSLAGVQTQPGSSMLSRQSALLEISLNRSWSNKDMHVMSNGVVDG